MNKYMENTQTHNINVQHQDINLMEALNDCDITKCRIFRSNHLNRNIFSNININNNIMDQLRECILNKIHSYFAHCFDIGHRLSIKDREMIDNKICDEQKMKYIENNDTSFDEYLIDPHLIESNKILKSKRESHQNISDQFNRNDKFNQLNDDLHDEKACGTFKMGVLFRYGYDGESEDSILLVRPKYVSFKEELTTNSISTISVKQFNVEYLKAQLHFRCNYRKQNYSKLFIENILSLMLYCNYTQLQYEFSKTYRRNVHQHNNYYFWGKYLKESVQQFGTKIRNGNIKAFYHGIRQKVSFDPHFFNSHRYNKLCIHCPLSTSSSFEVAANFASDGLIIEFGEYDSWVSDVGYFSVSWLSDFGNESEYLFLQSEWIETCHNCSNSLCMIRICIEGCYNSIW